MKPTLRSTLANSNTATFAIAVQLIWAFDLGFQMLWGPVYKIGYCLVTAILILDVPDFSEVLSRFVLGYFFVNLVGALTNFLAAYLLSRWVFGMGPFQSLRTWRERLRRRSYAQAT